MPEISNSRFYTVSGGGTMPYLLPGTYLDRFTSHDIIIIIKHLKWRCSRAMRIKLYVFL
jgi:hypothetical protein